MVREKVEDIFVFNKIGGCESKNKKGNLWA